MLITKTIAVFKNAVVLLGPKALLPKTKNGIMALGQTVNPNIGISPIASIDVTANYFKHYNEWPSDWFKNTPAKGPVKGPAKQTIQKIKDLNMTSEIPTDNLGIALRHIGAEGIGVSLIATIIEEWRLTLARYIPLRNGERFKANLSS